jgi:uncharacterized Zn finger protein
MTIPNALYIECPNCGERTLHEVLKGKMGRKQLVLETTVRCKECGHTHFSVIREERPVSVPVVVSDQGQSRKERLELGEDEFLSIGDELFVGETYSVITSIEKDGKRVNHSPAGEIETLWVKRYDQIKVKISVNKGQKTIPSEIFAMPDEEFFVGDIIPAGRDRAVINKMKTQGGMVRDGSVEARNIVRIYAKVMRVINA